MWRAKPNTKSVTPVRPGGISVNQWLIRRREERGVEEGPRVRENNHGQNNQEFLDFLNLATAQIRTLLVKQPGLRHTTTKSRGAS